MTVEAQEPARSRGPRRKRGQTRALLIEACVELVRTEGAAAVTTRRVTARAGIGQSGFYNHFDNTDALLTAAVGDVLQDMAARRTAVRRAAWADFGPADFVDVDRVERALATEVSVFLSEPAFAEIFLRYRLDAALLDGAVVAVDRAVREQCAEDLWDVARTFGARPEDYGRVAFAAEQVLSLHYGACESMLRDRYSHPLSLRGLAEGVAALHRALFEGLGVCEPARELPR